VRGRWGQGSIDALALELRPARVKLVRVQSFATLLAALLCASQAHAGCRLTTLEVPVTMDGLRPLVGAKVDGKPVKLLLDSGAFVTSLDARFVSERKLKHVVANPIGSKIPMATSTGVTGAVGVARASAAVRADFEFAGMTYPALGFLTISSLGGPDGLIGQNVLHGSDDEYDLKNGMLRLVRPMECETTPLAYWAKPGETYSVAELEPSNRFENHNMAIIWINGQKMHAFFDTGAETSFITKGAAVRAGVKTTDPGVKAAGMSHGVDGDLMTWVAPFASIKIGEEEIKNTRLAIGDSHAEDFDVLIGADFFLAHHVYVANSQGKVYFTYSGGPVFRAAAPPTTSQAPTGETPK
jgi:predicted aspartyl protease